MLLRHVIEALLNPFFIGFMLLICGILLIKKHTKRARWVLLSAFSMLLAFSTGILPQYLIRRLEYQYPIITRIDPSVHWVVVLSGGQSEMSLNHDTMPANDLLYSASLKRLIEGVRLYRQLPSAKLLLSGGGYGDHTPEAEHLARVASWFQIPASDIVLETRSVNTHDQAQAIQSWTHQAPFYLVTSAIHMPRAIVLCHQQHLHPIAAPTDFTLYWNDERWSKTYLPNPNNLMITTIAWHELLGTLYARIFFDVQPKSR